MALAEKVRELRRKERMSLDELARKAGISKSYLWQLEKGRSKRPSADILYKLASSLGTTIADLLGLEVKISGDDIEALPQGLKDLAQERALSPEDVKMLVHIRYRGRQPRTKEDWNFIYEAIIKSVAER